MNALNTLFDNTGSEYSLAPYDLIRFLRSKVKVIASRRGGECIQFLRKMQFMIEYVEEVQ